MATRYNWMADTSEDAFRVLVGLNRKLTPGEKLALVLEMSAGMVRSYEDRVRRDFPQATPREVFLRAAALRLGADVVMRVYGSEAICLQSS